MFEGIQRNLSEALKKLRGRGRITEINIKEAMREVRRALLEADVNLTVVDTCRCLQSWYRVSGQAWSGRAI